MRAIIVFSACSLVLSTSAIAKTALEAGASAAAKRGLSGEQARCYASVFADFAAQDGNGNWAGPKKSKAANTYKSTLLSKCGVSR